MTDYIEEFKKRTQRIFQAIKSRECAPHCDPRILHAPGECWACDGYPDWQKARETWKINFTGESDSEKLPCPAQLQRSLETIYHWGPNRPAVE